MILWYDLMKRTVWHCCFAKGARHFVLMSDVGSDTSFEVGLNEWHRANSSPRQNGGAVAPSDWHAQLIGGPTAETYDELRAPAQRARRPSAAPIVADVTSSSSPLLQSRSVHDHSSIRFDVDMSGDAAAAHNASRHRTTIGESSIEYEVLSPHTPPSRLTTPLGAYHSDTRGRRVVVQGGARRAHSSSQGSARLPQSDHRAGVELRYRDPLERLYHVGLDRKLAKQQWACLERAKRRVQDDANERCTFQPQISPYAGAIHRPKALSPQFRANDEVKRKMEHVARRQRELAAEELVHCTFKPLTLSAAKLHASALLDRTHLHEDLFNDHKKRQAFRDHLQMEAVREIEERMLYRRDPSAERRYAGNDDEDETDLAPYGGLPKRSSRSRSPREVLSVEEVNGIVERLLHASIHHAEYEHKESFKPTINLRSKAILEERHLREVNSEVDNKQGAKGSHTKANDTPQTGSHAIEAEIGAARAAAALERRQHHAVALFNTLAQRTIEAERKKHTNDPGMPLDDNALAACSLPIPSVQATAEILLPAALFNEVKRCLWVHVSKHSASRISRDEFVKGLLQHTNFSSSDVSKAVSASLTTQASKGVPSHGRTAAPSSTQRDDAAPSNEDRERAHLQLVERLLKKQRNAQERIKQQREEQLEEQALRDAKACTFAPERRSRPPRPLDPPPLATDGHQPSTRQQNTSKHATHQAAMGASDSHTSLGYSASRRVSTRSGAAEMEHHVLLVEDLQLAPQEMMAVTTPTTGRLRASPQTPSPQVALACCVAAQGRAHACMSRDAISEHAAYGPPNALKDFGTALMQRQFDSWKD